jgi:hypothetical protein
MGPNSKKGGLRATLDAVYTVVLAIIHGGLGIYLPFQLSFDQLNHFASSSRRCSCSLLYLSLTSFPRLPFQTLFAIRRFLGPCFLKSYLGLLFSFSDPTSFPSFDLDRLYAIQPEVIQVARGGISSQD